MLREGLAAEFPFVKRALLSIRRPRVAREEPLWAALSGFGVVWLVGASGQFVAMVIRIAGFRDAGSWAAGAFAIVGAAFGVTVALRAGGRRGLGWYVAGLVVVAGLTFATQLPAYRDICARQILECSPIQFALPHIYTLGGLLLSVVAVRFVSSGAAGTNPVLSAAGAFMLLQPATIALWRLTSWVPSDPNAALALGLGFAVVGMFAAGIVIRLRSANARPAVVFGVILTALWLGQQGPLMWDVIRGAYAVTGPVNLYPVLVGPAEVAALALGWVLPKLLRPDDGSSLM